MRASKIHWNLPVVAGIALGTASLPTAADLPTAKSIAAEMGMGWNIANTMEVPGNPTGWGNPLPSQRLIDSVKAAGFKTIRIPCAWDSYADASTLVIKPSWIAQVKQVVDYCIKDSLFVVLNIHWDGGWLENRIDSSATDDAMRQKIARKQGAYWRQIATTFKDYDRHLLLASANEPNVADSTGAAGSKILNTAGMKVLNTFHQTFIDTVRATGGNNATRTLVIQGPSTDIEKTEKLMTTLPTDKVADRLMAEVHFYPYQFSLMEQDADWGNAFYYWGKGFHSTTDLAHNPTWGEESWVDSTFGKMKTQFVDKGVPVLLGEFGVNLRTTLNSANGRLHILSRRWFYNQVVALSKKNGLIPVAWDVGAMKILDRDLGSAYDMGLLNAMRTGMGLDRLSGDTSLPSGPMAAKILCSAKDSLYAQVELGVAKPDISGYDTVLVRAYVNGTVNYDSAGVSRTGNLSLGLVTMSDNWTWREASFGSAKMGVWNTYAMPLARSTSVAGALVSADPTKIDFFALKTSSHGYRGTIYLDWIAFKTKAGAADTLYNFDMAAPTKSGGNVSGMKLIPTDSVANDKEWMTATTSKYSSTDLAAVARNRSGLRQAGKHLVSTKSSAIRLTDLRGRLVRGSIGTMSLDGLPQGVYLASDGISTLRVPLAQ